MKKLRRDPAKLEALNLFSTLLPEGKTSFFEPGSKESFLSRMTEGLTSALGSQGTLHGARVQSMFEHMVVSFNEVKLLKQEDAGTCYGESIVPPDYRVITESEEHFLIEVKNHFHNDATKPFRIRDAYLAALIRYADVMKCPLRIAIYWAKWNLWTLNDVRYLASNGRYSSIELPAAMKTNLMATLGDYSVGTKYPLTLRLLPPQDQPIEISITGELTMTIGGAELACAGVIIRDKIAENYAFYLMLYGEWKYNGALVEMADGNPIAIVHTVEPEMVSNPNEQFEIIGSRSSMFSTFYNSFTLGERGVEGFRQFDTPEKLGPMMPPDYRSPDLPLWRFVLRPN